MTAAAKQMTTSRSRNAILVSQHSGSTGSELCTDSIGSNERHWNLNISNEKLANIKSPMFLRLEAMITTVDQFRKEFDGTRVPMYEVAFLAKKKKDEERLRREQRRKERQDKKDRQAEYERQENARNKLFRRKLLDDGNSNNKKSTLEILNGYKVNTYEMPP